VTIAVVATGRRTRFELHDVAAKVVAQQSCDCPCHEQRGNPVVLRELQGVRRGLPATEGCGGGHAAPRGIQENWCARKPDARETRTFRAAARRSATRRLVSLDWPRGEAAREPSAALRVFSSTHQSPARSRGRVLNRSTRRTRNLTEAAEASAPRRDFDANRKELVGVVAGEECCAGAGISTPRAVLRALAAQFRAFRVDQFRRSRSDAAAPAW